VRLLLKKLLRAIALVVVPFVGSLLIRLLYLTNKKEIHIPKQISDAPIIFACWHGELLMCHYIYARYRKIPHAKVLISNHFDGMLIAKTIEHFGLDTIAGSSNRNAAKALIQGIKALKDGWDIGITPDGPQGPRHKAADGVVVMAQKADAKIMLIEMVASRYWQLSSWDKFTIPKPFGTIRLYASELLDVSQMELEEAKELVQKGLLLHER
jgi:lysophospholipid acyltransferase (LPLAT)-like uncharacterized protein